MVSWIGVGTEAGSDNDRCAVGIADMARDGRHRRSPLQLRRNLQAFVLAVLMVTQTMGTFASADNLTAVKSNSAKADQNSAQSKPSQLSAAKQNKLNKINHIIVIFMENWSFDGLYGLFDGADGVQKIDKVAQLDQNGQPYQLLPAAMDNNFVPAQVDARIPTNLPVGPFDLSKYVSLMERTGDPRHRFYNEQEQIDGGKMDRFVALSHVGSLAMSYYDARKMPLGKWASEYTLCDHFFHAAFGGSWLNNVYLLSAHAPKWDTAPKQFRCQYVEGRGQDTSVVTDDGYIVNNPPPPLPKGPVPYFKHDNICDRLSDKGISWAWYGDYVVLLLDYLDKYKPGMPARKHIRPIDSEIFDDIIKGELPQVSFLHQVCCDEHPALYPPLPCEQYTDSILKAIKNSKYWNDCLIVITYDENGGRWDHVPPPHRDRFGPGTRVPTIIISPFAKKHFVDHNVYDTCAISKLIESRYQLPPCADADAKAADLSQALNL